MAANELSIAKERYLTWFASSRLSEEQKAELKDIEADEDEIKQRFCSYLSFGTAGLRGVMAMGTNNMNIHTVCHATQGFAEYINSCGDDDAAERGIVIGFDSRNGSKEFARSAAAVMANNGIKVYIFPDICPTPEISFAIRHLGTIAGINVTASHNPKQYNGYKAYWEDGAQLAPEQADAVSEKIGAVDIFSVRLSDGDFERGIENGMISVIGDDVHEKFLENVLAQRICPDILKSVSDDLSIVYTPLYGAGYRLAPEAMRRMGIKHLYTVDEQMTPNGSFPTTPFPNPELPEVFELATKLAIEKNADIIIASDPDADRIGAMIQDDDGNFITLTGNQIGAMLLDYIISAEKELGTLPTDAFAVKTIVSTDIVTKICQVHGIKLYNVLTGFKFIGKVVSDYESETGRAADDDFLLGFEESNGYMRGTYLRDKDAICATALMCEMAAYWKSHGKTVYQALRGMYERYGLYKEKTSNIYMEGLDGASRMAALMSRLRSEPPKELGGKTIRYIRDYLTGVITDIQDGITSETGLPESNVLFYELYDGNKIVIRPSGTEPKIKIYYLLHSENGDEAELDALLEKLISSMEELAGIRK